MMLGLVLLIVSAVTIGVAFFLDPFFWGGSAVEYVPYTVYEVALFVGGFGAGLTMLSISHSLRSPVCK